MKSISIETRCPNPPKFRLWPVADDGFSLVAIGGGPTVLQWNRPAPIPLPHAADVLIRTLWPVQMSATHARLQLSRLDHRQVRMRPGLRPVPVGRRRDDLDRLFSVFGRQDAVAVPDPGMPPDRPRVLVWPRASEDPTITAPDPDGRLVGACLSNFNNIQQRKAAVVNRVVPIVAAGRLRRPQPAARLRWPRDGRSLFLAGWSDAAMSDVDVWQSGERLGWSASPLFLLVSRYERPIEYVGLGRPFAPWRGSLGRSIGVRSDTVRRVFFRLRSRMSFVFQDAHASLRNRRLNARLRWSSFGLHTPSKVPRANIRMSDRLIKVVAEMACDLRLDIKSLRFSDEKPL